MSGFLEDLARGVIAAGGAPEDDPDLARARAREAWAELQRLGPDAYPCMVELHGIRYVYLWEVSPPTIAVMVWDDQMWRDMAHVPVPDDVR